MSYRDPLEAALARVGVLEAELADYRAGQDAASVEHRARLRIEGELIVAQHELTAAQQVHAHELEMQRTAHAHELETLRASHEHALTAQKAHAAAQLDIVERSLQAQLQIAEARANAALSTTRAAGSEEVEVRDGELARAQSEVEELRAEVEALTSFSPQVWLAYYEERVARAEADAAAAEAERVRTHDVVRRTRAYVHSSGTRTPVEMAQLDMKLAMAESEAHAADVRVRQCREAVGVARAKLERCRGATGARG